MTVKLRMKDKLYCWVLKVAAARVRWSQMGLVHWQAAGRRKVPDVWIAGREKLATDDGASFVAGRREMLLSQEGPDQIW